MTLPPLYLYGGPKPFIPPPWVSTNDTLRGGSSTSSLTPSITNKNAVLFAGHLDTQTLGGAGFAAQFSPSAEKGEDRSSDKGSGKWDLTGYLGMEIKVGRGDDGKSYTLVLKDSRSAAAAVANEDRVGGADGNENGTKRPESSLSWEAEFNIPKGKEEDEIVSLWLPWNKFKATYRGKPVEDEAPLWKGGQLHRVGLMMRSYFGTQQGDFHLEVLSLCAQ